MPHSVPDCYLLKEIHINGLVNILNSKQEKKTISVLTTVYFTLETFHLPLTKGQGWGDGGGGINTI